MTKYSWTSCYIYLASYLGVCGRYRTTFANEDYLVTDREISKFKCKNRTKFTNKTSFWNFVHMLCGSAKNFTSRYSKSILKCINFYKNDYIFFFLVCARLARILHIINLKKNLTIKKLEIISRFPIFEYGTSSTGLKVIQTII